MPNTYFGDLNLANKTFDTLDEQVTKKLEMFQNETITLIVDDQKIETSPLELGISFNKESSIKKIIEQNKNYYLKLASLIIKHKVIPEYGIDFGKFSSGMDALLKDHEIRARNASIVYQGNKFLVEEEKVGSIINRTQVALKLREEVEHLSSGPIEVTKVTSIPTINKERAQKAQERINLLASVRIVLTYGYEQWEISGKRLLDLLTFSPSDQEEGYVARVFGGQTPLAIESLKLSDSNEPILVITINREGLNSFTEEMAKVINSPTVDATIKFEGGKVVEFVAARDGQKLDVEKTRQLVNQAISIENPSLEKEITIKLPVTVTPAKIASSEINSLGIQELIGRGISYFAGSIPNRAHNLSLAARRTSGTLVEPGGIFSFNQIVGEVSAATGYKPAYVISAGRTVLDDGGGICQVSTTIFRAALNSGLPIVARTAHAYRVGYYEQRGFKPGLDATVWAPAVDFQFKNDTDHYILVQAVVDMASAKLQVDIYGTLDRRRVEITDPVISNRKMAPADKYQEDPTLPRGTVKQVDFAAEGATVVFGRRVYKGDKVIVDESFKSNFQPWQAVYLVGTGG